MFQTALLRLAQYGRSRFALAAYVIFMVLVGISFLAVDLARQVEERSESRSDNAQWLLSQFELELLYLLTVADAAAHEKGDLRDVRLRYDIFFGRMKMLREGRVSELLVQEPGFQDGFGRLEGFVQTYLPLIDGPDDALQARLPNLVADGLALTRTARELALTGVRVSAANSDRKREEVARTLTLTGGLTAALVLFLLALLGLLMWLFRFNRKSTAENLATLSRLNAVVSTTMEALVTVDGQGRIRDLNQAARLAFGLDGSAQVGTDMASLFEPSPGEAGLFRPGQAPDVVRPGRFRLSARHSDGRIFPTEVSISRVTGMEPALFVVFLRDLSSEVQAEQALVAARDKALAGEKAKAELLAVMSHEIRTPLNGMIGTVELLDHTELNDEQREYLRILQASGRLLMHHVNDVLDISRLESGVATPVLLPVDLAEIVREVIENQLPASRAHGNRMSFEPPAGSRFVILSDGAQLRQVLLNLVGNAVKFTTNGRIDVDLEEDDAAGEVLIRVRDTGIGIAAEDRDRIFDDFVTLDTSYARPSSGTGLGLGIVRRIVMQMGGRLTVESQVGLGSVFCISLPLRRLEAVEEARARGHGFDTAPTSLSVLIVEDNEFNRLIAAEFLRQDGHRVMEAADGVAGVALAEVNRFDVILMDISMPRMDGVRATAAIRAGKGRSSQSPVVAMTAHALDEDRKRFREGGLGSILIKPITREALRKALHQARTEAEDGRPILDLGVLAALGEDLGRDRAMKLIVRFRDELETGGAKVLAALRSGPDDDTQRLLHKLTGSTSMFGALTLGRLFVEIQTAWKTETPLEAEEMARRLHKALLATDAALQDPDLAQASSLR